MPNESRELARELRSPQRDPRPCQCGYPALRSACGHPYSCGRLAKAFERYSRTAAALIERGECDA